MNKQAQKQAQILAGNQASAPVGGWGEQPFIVGGTEETIRANRGQWVGIPATAFTAAGQTKVVEVKVSRACKPKRLVIPASIADNFILTNITILNRDQNLGNGPIPCEVFSQDAKTSDVEFDTVPQNGAINLSVTSVAAGTFSGAFQVASVE